MHMLITSYLLRMTLGSHNTNFKLLTFSLLFKRKWTPCDFILWIENNLKSSKAIYLIFMVYCNFCIIFHRLLHTAMSHSHCLWKFLYLFSLIQKLQTGSETELKGSQKGITEYIKIKSVLCAGVSTHTCFQNHCAYEKLSHQSTDWR